MNPACQFIHDPVSGRYLPAYKAALVLCDDLGRLTLTADDLTVARFRGHRPTLTNGQDIGLVEVIA